MNLITNEKPIKKGRASVPDEEYTPSPKLLDIAHQFILEVRELFPDRKPLTKESYALHFSKMIGASEAGVSEDNIKFVVMSALNNPCWGSNMIMMRRCKYDKRSLGTGEMGVDSMYESWYKNAKNNIDAAGDVHGILMKPVDDMTNEQVLEEVFEDSSSDEGLAEAFRIVRSCFDHTRKLTEDRLECLVALTETLWYCCSPHGTWVGDVPCRKTIGHLDAILAYASIMNGNMMSIHSMYPGSDNWKYYVAPIILDRFDPRPEMAKGEYMDLHACTPLCDVAQQYVNTEYFQWVQK